MNKVLTAALSLLLFLTACGGNSQAGSLDTDRAFSHASTNVCGAEDTVYAVLFDEEAGGGMIHYLDKTTGVSGPLCGRAECLHNGRNCNAYVDSRIWGLSSYNGRLYWIGMGEVASHYYIYSAAYDGSDRREERDLTKTGQFNSVGAEVAAFHRGYVYVSGIPSEIVDGEINYRCRVYTYSIDGTEEDHLILDEECSYHIDMRTQPYGDDLYVYTLDRSGEARYIQIRRWDAVTRELETLYEDEAPFYPSTEYWVTEEGILFYGTALDGEATDADGNTVYKRGVFFYDFESGGFSQMLLFDSEPISPETHIGASMTALQDNLLVLRIDCGDRYRFVAMDLEGRILLDTTPDVSDCPAEYVTWQFFAGADEENIYYHSLYTGLLVVPLDGSRPTGFWEGALI